MGLTAQVVELAKAARAEGVLMVRMRRGPVAELQLLPPEPPPVPAPKDDETPESAWLRDA